MKKKITATVIYIISECKIYIQVPHPFTCGIHDSTKVEWRGAVFFFSANQPTYLVPNPK